MIAYLIDTLVIVAAFALQAHLPLRPTIMAAVVIAVCLVIQLTVGRDNDHFFFVFLIMMAAVLALIVRGVRGQLHRRGRRLLDDTGPSPDGQVSR